jgi:hypothetical protein
MGLVRARAETVQLTEAVLRRMGLVRTRADTVQLGEAVLRSMGLRRIQSETVQLSEVTISRRGLLRIRGETVQLLETVTPLRGLLKIQNETVQWTEGRIGLVMVAFMAAFSALVALVPLFGVGLELGSLLSGKPAVVPLHSADVDLEPGGEA